MMLAVAEFTTLLYQCGVKQNWYTTAERQHIRCNYRECNAGCLWGKRQLHAFYIDHDSLLMSNRLENEKCCRRYLDDI